MSKETFKEWWHNQKPLTRYPKDTWNHQQKKIDELEGKYKDNILVSNSMVKKIRELKAESKTLTDNNKELTEEVELVSKQRDELASDLDKLTECETLGHCYPLSGQCQGCKNKALLEEG